MNPDISLNADLDVLAMLWLMDDPLVLAMLWLMDDPLVLAMLWLRLEVSL